MPELDISWRIRTVWRGALPLLRRVATHVLAAEGFREGFLSIAVVGRARMARLHDEFLGISSPTDVITFDLDTDRAAGHLEGEIVVCSDVALHNAKGSKSDAARELALYITHGILHLAGYDDRTPDEFRRMHAREDELLAKLGIGRIFSARNDIQEFSPHD